MVAIILSFSMVASSVYAEVAVPSVVEEPQAAATEVKEKEVYDAEQIFEKHSDSIFYLRTLREDNTIKTTGSGYLITEDGYAITANHVIDRGVKFTAEFADGTQIEGVTVVYTDKVTDMSLLKLPAREAKYKFIPFAAAVPKHGAKVFAIGYPMRGAQIITEGIVCSPWYKINDREMMLISSPLVSGMSGGPIINKYGEAVGLASGSMITMPTLHISSPTNNIIEVINKYINGGNINED